MNLEKCKNIHESYKELKDIIRMKSLLLDKTRVSFDFISSYLSDRCLNDIKDLIYKYAVEEEKRIREELNKIEEKL